MNELAKEILDTVEVGALATVNADRTPLVTPIHFARLDDSIIWISEPTARHSVNAFRSGKAEFVVWELYIAPIGKLDEKTTTGSWLHFIA